MGTNFYLHTDDPFFPLDMDWDRLGHHIGKRSAGWQFYFRAHESVRSFRDWVTVFENTPNATIRDEYGTEYDVVQFCREVVAPTKDGKNHVDYFTWPSWETGRRSPAPGDMWNDSEGWSICDYEFF